MDIDVEIQLREDGKGWRWLVSFPHGNVCAAGEAGSFEKALKGATDFALSVEPVGHSQVAVASP